MTIKTEHLKTYRGFMQANNSPRLLKNFMIGLIASGAGAFIALPGSAMPEPTEVGAEVEAIEAVETLDTVEAVPAPDAEETLPTEGAAMEESESVADDAEAMDEEPIADDAEMDEEPVADVDADTVEAADIEALDEEAIEAADTMDGEPVVEEVEAMDEEPVADDAEAMDEEPIADDAEMDEEPVAEDADATDEESVVTEADALETDADTVEAADIEALDEEAIEAADTMDGEPVVEEVEAMDEEPVADDTEMMDEEPVADDAEAMDEEPIADDAEMDEEPVATEEIDTAAFTIAELTDNDDSFEILAAALAAADLTEILGSEGPFTVFAPTDDAFADLPEGAIDQLMMPENKDVLVQVLTYHVVPGALLSTELETGSVATVEGSEVALDVADTVTVNNANVVYPDVEASNGVIHVIDRVIIPPSPEAAPETEVDTEDVTAE